MKFHEKIWIQRKKAGLSQEALGELLGVSRQAVSKWETGESTPEIAKLKGLAEAFGTSVDWLLSEDEEIQPDDAPRIDSISVISSADWIEGLPKVIRQLVRTYGWLAGVEIAVSGALFTGMGLLGRFMAKSILSDPFGGNDMLFPQDDLFTNLAANNPMTIMSTVIMVFGLVLLIGGIILALVLKRKFQTVDDGV